MTWRPARARIVEIIESTPTSSLYLPDEYGGRMTYSPGMLNGFGRSRQFALRGVSMDTLALATGRSSRWATTDVELTIDYPIHRLDDGSLDEVIFTDYEALRERLLDASLWSRPSSTIVSTLIPDRAMECTTEDVDGDDGASIGRRMTIRFPLTHTAQES